jgi:hypothetical protein
MLIGIDLDNTIINYNTIFQKLITQYKIKKNHRNDLKSILKEGLKSFPKKWTELQGEIYGKKIFNAKVFENFDNFLKFSKNNNISIIIISHKTKYPYIGKKINLQNYALKFLKKKLKNFKYIEKIFFENNIENKIKRIVNEDCDIFIDDLKKVLNHKLFPQYTEKIHFNNVKIYNKSKNWNEIKNFIKNKINQNTYNNNRNYIIENKNKIFVKKFHDVNNFKKENIFYNYLYKKKINNFPKILKANLKRLTIKQIFIKNTKIRYSKKNLLQKNINFIKKINEYKKIDSKFNFAKDFTNGGEEYEKEIKKRIRIIKKKFRKFNFIKSEMVLNIIIKKFKLLKKKKYFSKISHTLSKFKILSPCDFHYKNMIYSKNKIYYFDFEYSGIDDSAKLLASYFLQPEKFFSYRFYLKNENLLKRTFKKKLSCKRIKLLFPVIYLRWALILCNSIDDKNSNNENIKQLRKIKNYLIKRKEFFLKIINN